MDQNELLEENKMLRTLLGLAGLSEKDRAKRILMHDLYTLNSMIVNFINKSSTLRIDLADLRISNKSTAELFISTNNIPVVPLFSLDPVFIAHTMELCQEGELFSKITLEHMRMYW